VVTLSKRAGGRAFDVFMKRPVKLPTIVERAISFCQVVKQYAPDLRSDRVMPGNLLQHLVRRAASIRIAQHAATDWSNSDRLRNAHVGIVGQRVERGNHP